MSAITPGWRLVTITTEGHPVSLAGINPWGLQWHGSEEPPITVAHPQYPSQRHTMWVYELRANGSVVRFAAGEFSANVWGFYLPE